MKSIKILEKNTSRLLLVTTLILFAITLVGTVQAQNPTLTVIVTDDDTGDCVEGANVKIYNSTYNLVGQGTTDVNGTKEFSVPPNDYYYIVISHSEYNDEWTSLWVFTDDETEYVYLDPVHYFGSVSAVAWVEQPTLNPGDKGTLKVSIYNENETYAITLVNVTVEFPWYGFYEGEWMGNDTIVEDLPVDVEAEDYWSDTLSFTVPSDSRASVLFGPGGQVCFNVKAEAYKRVVVMTISGPAYAADPELTTVKHQFTTTPSITTSLPTFDPTVNDSLFLVQILLILSIVFTVILIAVGLRISGRLGKQISPAK